MTRRIFLRACCHVLKNEELLGATRVSRLGSLIQAVVVAREAPRFAGQIDRRPARQLLDRAAPE